MGGNSNPGARQRAEAELRADPYRSNYVIAEQASCAAQHVGRLRGNLERAGLIEAVPPDQRKGKPRPLHIPSGPRGPRPSRTRAAIRVLGPGATYWQVAGLAGTSHQAAHKMMIKEGLISPAPRRAATMTSPADLAAAADAISVLKTASMTLGQFQRHMARRNAKRASAAMDALSILRPCKPSLPAIDGEYPVGWPRPSRAAARLCRSCPVSQRCPVSLA